MDICLDGIDDLDELDRICESKENRIVETHKHLMITESERESFENWGGTVKTHYADILYPVTI